MNLLDLFPDTDGYDSLVKKANNAREQYYNTGEEVMSNREYDALFDKITGIEERTGKAAPDSPTQGVGAAVVSQLKKVAHEYPALSLAKTKDIDEFVNTFRASDAHEWGDDAVTLMWKLDGSTVQLTYIDGQLVLAATRGDGEVGLDITHNASSIAGIPLKIADMQVVPHKLVVRGEATMGYTEFSRINSKLPEGVEPYKNPRNLANASIEMLDSSMVKGRGIKFRAFEMVYSSSPISGSFNERLNTLADMGFGVVNHVRCGIDELKAQMGKWSKEVPEYDTPVDGLVAAYDRCEVCRDLPGTAHHPNPLKGFAFKWADETASTTLRKIEWSASRTGLLNPVAVFDPVELEGTTVTRSTVSNLSQVERLHLHVGDQISVYKANKIIPAIAENLTPGSGDDIDVPHFCPVCGFEADVATNPHLGVLVKTLWCRNPGCPAKSIGRYVHFCERDCMNIEGMSDATVTRLVDAGFIKEFADIYTLGEHRAEIAAWDGFGEKSVDKLLSAIEASRATSFVPFLHALGIPQIGKGQAKLLSKEYAGDVMAFFHDLHDRHDFTHIEGIGEVLQDCLWQWGNEYLTWIPFADNISQLSGANLEIYNLLAHIHFNNEVQSVGGALSGMTFVITGSVEHFENRDAIKAFIESNGGKTSESVSSKTSFLVNNDVSSTSGKNKKAKELGIEIIPEQELLDMVNA